MVPAPSGDSVHKPIAPSIILPSNITVPLQVSLGVAAAVTELL